MFSGTLTGLITCEATNVGDKPIKSVTVRLVPVGGVASPEQTCQDMPPSGLCIATVSTFFWSGSCRVDFTGSKRSIRGSMSVIEAGNNVRQQLATQ
jgi:hypothetical protein